MYKKTVGEFEIIMCLPGRYMVCHAKSGRTASAHTYQSAEEAERYIKSGFADWFCKSRWNEYQWDDGYSE